MSLFELIRGQINLSNVARCFTELNGSGARLLGCCPLPNHNDSNPSFNVYPDGRWYCFGCREYGDVVDLWAAVKGLQPVEAAVNLASEYGVQLPDHDPGAQKKASDRRQKEGDYARQAEGYHQLLSSHTSIVAHLQQRGFSEELQKRFLLGSNHDGSSAVIPFWHRGRIHGLIRRQLDREPKYLLPKSERFSSGYKPLFIPGSIYDDLHLVEGYIDALALAAMDLSAIAPGGTGMSQEQKQEIERLKGDIYIFPDADEEGTKAALHWVKEFYPRAKLCPADYGEGRKDVADLFAAEGERAKEIIEQLKSRAVDALDLVLNGALKGSTRERYRYARAEVLPLIERISDEGERIAAIEDAAKSLGLKSSDLRRVLKLTAALEDETANESPVLVLHDPELWPEPVDGSSLLDEIAATIARFISASEAVYKALALWALYSHAFNIFDVSPLLAIISPEKRCGKTTLLTLLGAFVPRPLFTSNITASALFRTIEKYRPTLLIDEADTFLTGDETLRGILNSGHHRNGAYIIRAVGEDYEPRQFTTWAPKAIAMIGNLPSTVDDRALKIKMQRKRTNEVKEKLRLDKMAELEPFCRRAARWCTDNLDAIKSADPDIPEQISNDRARDNWRVLLAIADVVGGKWPVLAREVACAMAGEPSDSESVRVLLLGDLKALFDEQGDRLTSEEIIQSLIDIEGHPWGEWKGNKPLSKTGLANLLRPFSIRPGKWREGDETQRGYRRSDFEDVFGRYLGNELPQTPHAENTKIYSENEPPQAAEPVAVPNDDKWNEIKDVAFVADQKAVTATNERERFEI